jgi:thioredoxin 1
MLQSKKILQILIPALILLAIAGIWLFKNNPFSDSHSKTGEPLEVTVMDIEELTSQGLPAMLDFGSETCGPCQAMAPDLEEIHAEMEGRAIIRYTDVWAYPENGENLPIQVVPTQFFFNADGSPFEPSEELSAEIGGFTLYSLRETDEHVYTVHEGMLSADQMRKILAEMGVTE